MSTAGIGLIGLLIFAHAMDYATFLAMVARHGIGTEANPLVSMLAQEYGLLLLTVAKIAAVLLVASTFIVIERRRPVVAILVLVIGIGVGMLGTITNIATFQQAGVI